MELHTQQVVVGLLFAVGYFAVSAAALLAHKKWSGCVYDNPAIFYLCMWGNDELSQKMRDDQGTACAVFLFGPVLLFSSYAFMLGACLFALLCFLVVLLPAKIMSRLIG